MRAVFTVFAAVALMFGLSASILAADVPTTTSAPSDPVKDFVTKGDAIVVAKVGAIPETIGGYKMLKDADPDKSPRTVQITRSLKGPDLQGQQIILYRNVKASLTEGTEYIFSLKLEAGPGYSQADKPMEATKENIAAVAKEVAAQGAAVSAARILWMKKSGSWGRGLITEFTLDSDGNFVSKEYAKGGAVTSHLVGKLPADEIKTLMDSIRGADKGPGAEDAGFVGFQFTDAKGKLDSKDYSMPSAAPCSNLVNAVQFVVQKYGKKPEPASKPAADTQPLTPAPKVDVLDRLRERAAAPGDPKSRIPDGPTGILTPPDTTPETPGTAPATTSAPATQGAMDNAKVDELVAAEAVKQNPKNPKPFIMPMIGKPVVADAEKKGLMTAEELAKAPLTDCAFRCVPSPILRNPSPAPSFACVRGGKVTLPFTAEKDFAGLLAGQDMSKWKDDDYLAVARLYVHLTDAANRDGWKVLADGDDFLKVASPGYPKDPAAVEFKAAAEKITKPVVVNDKAGTHVTFFSWQVIGGAVTEWTITFGKEFKAQKKSLGEFGGTYYE